MSTTVSWMALQITLVVLLLLQRYFKKVHGKKHYEKNYWIKNLCQDKQLFEIFSCVNKCTCIDTLLHACKYSCLDRYIQTNSDDT